jgi:hypothetical protein
MRHERPMEESKKWSDSCLGIQAQQSGIGPNVSAQKERRAGHVECGWQSQGNHSNLGRADWVDDGFLRGEQKGGIALVIYGERIVGRSREHHGRQKLQRLVFSGYFRSMLTNLA